jgi:valyl-tRNA synthetase
VVATTRPETMLGDAAVAVHPDDERYQALIGKTIILPITLREIPIIADDYVDPEFGTGCVKITPAHDFNDYDMGKRHNLPIINILTDDAKINDQAPQAYVGLDRFDARKKIVDDLTEQGLLVEVKPHKLKVPRGDRSGVVIEPYLTDQWYVAVESLAKPAIAVVESGEIKFIPENWNKTYYQWMNNIQDWCISRQLWWGHRIPAWFDEQGKIYVGKNEQDVRAKHKLSDAVSLRQDDDVLDTWFSSALWPFATMGWPNKTPELETFVPSSVLVTGFDIIFFWVARMVMMTKKFTGKIPFKEIYITGLIRDENGDKMSKSKGNVLDPIDLIDGIELEPLVQKRTSGMMNPKDAKKIEKATRKQFADGIDAYGTDALRFTFTSMASTSRDINFDMGRVEGYRNFCNKIWNATRFVLMNTEEFDTGNSGGELKLSVFDEWIWSSFQDTLQSVESAIGQYRFDIASQNLYEFTWNQFCDWYLELSKAVLNSSTSTQAEKRGTRHTLINVLEHLMRVLHPIMPFITDEIWQKIKPLSDNTSEVKSIMSDVFPVVDLTRKNLQSEADIEWVKAFVVGIRNIRGEMDIAPSKKLPVFLNNTSNKDKTRLSDSLEYLTLLAKLESIEIIVPGTTPPASATAFVGEMEIMIPMAGLIDKNAELVRLSKAADKLQGEVKRTQGKLGNENFVSKAPVVVIDKEKAKLADAQMQLQKIEEQVEAINAL